MEDSIKQLWLYNDWANKLVIDKLLLCDKEIPESCIRLLSHIVNAQLIWQNRIDRIPPTVGVWDMHSLSECKEIHSSTSINLQKKIKFTSIGVEIPIHYTNTKNEKFVNTLQEILLHIFNHGTYHRAQIATEMRKNGLEPINTDFITYARSKIEIGDDQTIT